MQETRSTFQELAAACVSAFPPFDDREQRIATETYRALAAGRPVRVEQIAQSVDALPDVVRDTLARWNSLVHYDREARVVAFIGLGLSPTAHCFEVDQRTLYTWCAWDTLFIPRVLGKAANVESKCPVTGRVIRLVSTPDGVRDLEPGETMVSFVTPERAQVETDVISSFCCHVHFLSSADDAALWTSQHDRSLVVSVEEAWLLGRICVDARLPVA
jgi:alkylmercury lyase